LNRSILLLSYSLKLAGKDDAQAILEECRDMAVQAAQFALSWLMNDPCIGFAPNMVINDIAYSVNVLIRVRLVSMCFVKSIRLTLSATV
jgi:hypothetical protein